MFQGTIGDLQNISQPLINIETDNTVDAANLLKRHNFTVTDVDQNHLYVPFTSKEQIGEINTLLIQNGITVFGINKQRKDLERLFLDITTQSN